MHRTCVEEHALGDRPSEAGIVALERGLECVEPALAPVLFLLWRQTRPIAQSVEADNADQRRAAVGEAAIDSAVIGNPIARKATARIGGEQPPGFQRYRAATLSIPGALSSHSDRDRTLLAVR